MTQVAFHFNVPDRLSYLCRLLRKAVGSGARVAVLGPGPLLRELDQRLWTFSAREFLAHCSVDASPTMRRASPIVLGSDAHAEWPHHDVLLNLYPGVPEGFERFSRLIEVVPRTGDAEETSAARARWRHYRDRGYAIEQHDLSGLAS